MAITVGDILRITISGLYLEQRANNVFHYEVASWDLTADLGAVGLDVDNNLLNPISVLQSTDFVWDTIMINSLTNSSDKQTVSLVRGGTYVGLEAPSFLAYSFILNTTDGLTNPGHKRFGGVVEQEVDGNDWVNYNIGQAPIVADAMEANLTANYGGGSPGEYTLIPVIYGKPNPNRITAVFDPVSTVVGQPNMTTQNSRKVGRGV